MIYLVAILLALLAAGFVLWPLARRGAHPSKVSHEQVVKSVYRERIHELDNELEDDALRAEIESDLGAVLLSESQLPEVENQQASGRRIGTLLLALCVPILGGLLYLSVADLHLDDLRGAEVVMTLSSEETAALEGWLEKLQARAAVAPDDSKSLYLLGHTQLKLGQFSKAAESFALTNQLVPEDLNIQIYWLQSRYLAARGVLDEVGLTLANSILEQQPGLSVVLEMLALDAFRRGDAETSIHLLNRALTGATDLRRQASFATAIKQVRAGLENPPKGISVKISADSTAPAHASVFVAARPLGGGMPFAAVRRPGFLLPFEVRLDDLVSMSPTRKLSDTAEFEVVVRLSESGQAMPQPGDWQWVSQPLQFENLSTAVLEAVLVPGE